MRESTQKNDNKKGFFYQIIKSVFEKVDKEIKRNWRIKFSNLNLSFNSPRLVKVRLLLWLLSEKNG